MHEHREKVIIAYARQAIKDIVLPSEKIFPNSPNIPGQS